MGAPSTEELKGLVGSYAFFVEMQRLTKRAAEGETDAIAALDEMLGGSDSTERETAMWQAAALRALVSTGRPEARQVVLRHLSGLKAETPYGIIELYASLLPVFGAEVAEDLCQLLGKPGPESAAVRAAALQALCQMFLETGLETSASALDALRKAVTDFEPDQYLSQHLVEMVQPKLLGKNAGAVEESDLDQLLKDVIVEG